MPGYNKSLFSNSAFFIILLTFFVFIKSSNAQNKQIFSDSLPAVPFLPDPLLQGDGTSLKPITTQEQWEAKKKWIREQYKLWIFGSTPPAPDNLRAEIISDKIENGVRLLLVKLIYGPENKGTMRVELMMPKSNKPQPVFMTQWYHRGWAQIAVRRGYIGCVYAAADDDDDTENYNIIYPAYDFSLLMKRAWATSRVVDYLLTLPGVDKEKIALTGHSRNGKLSLLAAAFDERIKAVITSSGGTGAENPFRYTDDNYDNENIDEITKNFPEWFHPNLRLFIGKENKLPVDQNLLMACIAPRGLMVTSAINESEGGPWGIEQAYFSAKKAYNFLHAENKIAILFRHGEHGTSARDIEDYVDFFDYVFERRSVKPENNLYYNYSFCNWKQLSNENINPLHFPANDKRNFYSKNTFDSLKQSSLNNIRWLLGNEPKGVSGTGIINEVGENTLPYDDYLTKFMSGPFFAEKKIKKITIGPYNPAGEYLWANVYFPEGTDSIKPGYNKKFPLVIFLHEYSHTTGYRRRCENIIGQLTSKGFAVLGFDMIGYGTRIEEFKKFYERYPHWSLMGKMVSDTRFIINDAFTRMPFVDTANVFLTGYSLGGTIALLSAALDQRVKGVAVAAASNSLKKPDPAKEGISFYSHLHGLLPRLGFFRGYENRIPVDFDDIIGAIAPRNLLILAPVRDWHNPIGEVRDIVRSGKQAYDLFNVPGAITLKEYDMPTRFREPMQTDIADWMQKVVNKKTMLYE